MHRSTPLLAIAAALACARPAPPSGFVLKVGLSGPIGEVGPEASSGAAALAGDVLFESVISPRPGGWSSRFLRHWERIGPRTWRLEVFPGIAFSDGSPVGPQEIARSLEPQGLRVRTAAGGTVEVDLPAGEPLEVALAMSVVSRRSDKGFVGTSSFSVAAQSADRLVLRRKEDAPGKIAQVELVAFQSGREAFARLLRGEVNAMFPVDRAQVELLDGVPGLRVVRGNSPHAVVVLFGPGVPAEQRRALAAWFPVGSLAAALRREANRAEAGPERPPLPPGRPLRIGLPRSLELSRVALALRQALGPRGGEIVSLGLDAWAARAREFDLFVMPMLVRPPGVGALYFATGAPYNWMGYSEPDYDAALAAGDEAAAGEALRRNPPVVIIARRERLAAIDARLPEARLGDWGAFESLADWEVAP